MKKTHTLESIEDVGFSVLGINSHAKPYTFCWNVNKQFNLSFEKVSDQTVGKNLFFSRYFCSTTKGDEYNIVTNLSKEGYLIPDHKNTNYFLVINNKNWKAEKKDFIKKLRKNKEVLLVFEVDVKTNKYTDRFIFKHA